MCIVPVIARYNIGRLKPIVCLIMNTPKIIFFDIDDTLYRKYTDTLRPSVSKAMEALKARGILTAIATGRPPVAIPGKVKTLIRDSGIDMLVTINGQYTTFHGEVLQAYPMIEAEVERMCTFFDSQYIDYAFVNNDEIVASAAGERVKEALSHILPAFEVDKEYFRKQSVYQMLVFADKAQEQEIIGKIQSEGFKSVRWHESALDMLRREGSKARGIAHAVEKLGIGMEDVMAFGDSFNDLEMLSSVGFGVAMGNGEEAAKAAAKFIAPSVDEDGVYRALVELEIIDG